MKFMKYSVVAVTILFIPLTSPSVLAQSANQSADEVLEEIVVHGRKREESVLEVPVSISVFSASELDARGIRTQLDLFDATPSLTFDVNTDGRQGTNPGIRGVQSALIATNQQKVNNFIDGMPMLGSAGVLQFDGGFA